ncbi:helicase ARIP4-like [Ptychodera flava]|uniref:helicase ARIP4-like n=1 Tax=Ptychodera flava TaxID=63121 RepID=UPI00396A6E78
MEVDTLMFSESDEEEFLPAGLQSDISSISVSSRSPSPSSTTSSSPPSPTEEVSLSPPDATDDISSSSVPAMAWSNEFDLVADKPDDDHASEASAGSPCQAATSTKDDDSTALNAMSSAFVSVPKDLMSDGDSSAGKKKKTKKKVRRKRKSDETTTQEGGKKKRKKKGEKNDGEVKEKKKKKNKPANKRRNIKALLTEDKLTADTLAAQLQEEQRKQRLIELQKMREELQNRSIVPPPPLPLVPEPQTSASTAAFLSALLDKPAVHAPETIVVKRQESQARVIHNVPAPRSMIDTRLGGPTEPECIVLDASSGSDEDQNKKPPEPVKKQSDVIEILSSDDDVVVASESSDNDADDGDMDNSGQHTNDEMNQPDSQGRVLVNINHPPKEEDIFLSPQLAKAVKPHQIGGIRFLYDNLVESLQRYKSSNGFGCILAHSMGLGKTLQVISFIDIFLRHTPAKRVLCIVPINTIQNWQAEFDMWVPVRKETPPEDGGETDKREIQYREFNVHIVNDNHKTTAARAKAIGEWHESGGVLLMGYEMYRLLTLKKFTGSRRRKKNRDQKTETVIDLEEEDKKAAMASAIMTALIQPGPDLVVCDEGHRIKNTHASISQTLKNIQTRRRVVLTGYPLQNNLLEYWCMVDFVRPNFLGTKAEFSNLFERPIMNGQCVDSTPKDVKMMQFRAHILHSLLEGFVQRRSHAVLHRTLPQKEEHVILIRQTTIQNILYHRFMHYFKEMGTSGWCSANPIKAFSVCCKIWNHPDVLYEAMQQRSEAESGDVDIDLDLPDMGSRSASPSTSVHRSASAPSLTALKAAAASAGREGSGRRGKLEQLPGLIGFQDKIQQVISFDWAADVMKNYKPNVLSNSNKMVTMFYILEESIKQGDKLLLFSQSLSTLNQIEKFLSECPIPKPSDAPEDMPTQWIRNKSYYRLDGSSSPSEREKMINHFNSPTNTSVLLFLLSTRAGCLGVNLVGANRVIIFDASWNPCHDAQAVCRVYRYGQTKNCHVYRLVTENTLEKKIYDRQISKQGMSDRVIDELNPELNLTKKEVESLLEYDESDMPYEDFGHHAKKYKDPILRDICSTYSRHISKEPFTHESLLIDKKESKLTRAEKRAAKKSYEAEKKLNISYSRPSYTAYYPKTSNPSQTGSSSTSINLSRFSSGQSMTVNRPVASVRPMQTTPIPMQPTPNAATAGVSDQVKQRLLNLKQAGVTVQKIVTTTAIHLPGLNTATSTSPMIKAGETINIIRTQKGIYVRNQEGKIYAVRPGPSRSMSQLNAASDGGASPQALGADGGADLPWTGNSLFSDNDKRQTPGSAPTDQAAEIPAVTAVPNLSGEHTRPSSANRSSQLPSESKSERSDIREVSPFPTDRNTPTNTHTTACVTMTTSTAMDPKLSTSISTSMTVTPTAAESQASQSSKINDGAGSSASKTDAKPATSREKALDNRTPSVIPPFGAVSLPSASGIPLPLMSLAGLPGPMAYGQYGGYYHPMPGMPPMQHPHTMYGPPPGAGMNPMFGGSMGGYAEGMPFLPVATYGNPAMNMTFSQPSSSGQTSESRNSTANRDNSPSANEPKAHTMDSNFAQLTETTDSQSNDSSRGSSPNSRLGEVGDLANLINFTQSNWLQNSMQRIGEHFLAKSDSSGEDQSSMDIGNDL